MKNRLNLSRSALLSLAVCLAWSVGCKDEVEEPEVEETVGVEVTEDVVEVEEVEVVEEPCTFATVYFAFDSSALDSAARTSIQEAAECYRGQDPNVGLLLVGATDPRGTEEYNLALGERRAASVRNYLVSLGMSQGKISVQSVGEERATGNDEASWALDRNVTGSED